MSVVKRITPHLKKIHGLKSGTKWYLTAYLKARPLAKESNKVLSHKIPTISVPVVIVIDDNDDECAIEKVNNEEIE